MSPPIFTIGHSTNTFEEFDSLLEPHGIKILIDIRRFPSSRKFPQFNQDNLAAALPERGIEYHWLEVLGGRRSKKAGDQSMNLGLRNESFRNYADYMLTDEFRLGIAQLLKLASVKPAAYMCSESVFWRCHRRLVSDFLLMKGFEVQHIMPNGELRPHTLTEGAQIKAEYLTYPATNATQKQLPFD